MNSQQLSDGLNSEPRRRSVEQSSLVEAQADAEFWGRLLRFATPSRRQASTLLARRARLPRWAGAPASHPVPWTPD